MIRLNYYRMFVFAALLAIAGWRCEPIVTIFDDVEEAVYYRAASLVEPPPTVDTLLVMTWNIKFGGGDIDFWFDCYGDRVLMTEEEVLSNLDRLADYINQVDPDILLLQEVDVDSKRAAYVDQMQYLLDHTALNYGVYASMWQVQFVPSDGLGRADMGPAILSRWPLDNAERIGLALRTDQDALTTYFYIRRCMVRARIQQLNNLYVVTVHTAAWSQDDTKLQHINRFMEELDSISDEGGLFVAGGDLNTLPPGSHQVNDFPDTKCEGDDFGGSDYSREKGWLTDLYNSDYHHAIRLDEYQQALDQGPYFTYGDKPGSLGFTRKLDYLFTNHAWIPGSATTHQDIASGGTTLSDHCPVSVRIRLPW